MRNYQNVDRYLNKLAGDIYPQPSGNDAHESLSNQVVYHWMSRLTSCQSVLDVGCGEGISQPAFVSLGVQYEGIALGEDVMNAQALGRNVKKMDFSFLDYPDESFDLIFSRHSLEHSPMPLLTLMEWYRVSKQWLGLVVPHPAHYTVKGRNHYSVMYHDQIMWLLELANWKPIWDEEYPPNADGIVPQEMWIFCEKVRK